MAIKYPLANGNWSNAANWNGGTKPVAGDDVYSGTFTVNVDENIDVASLRNTAISRPIATAQMTANNAPSPYVAAASSQGSGNDPFKAFNRNYTTNSDYWTTGVGIGTGWLSYDFASSIVIDGYTIYGTSTQANNPRNWTLEGSNDNINWTVLHTVTLAAAIAGNGTYSIASIGNSTSYRYYRINISLGGGTSLIGFTELELYQPNTAALSAGGTFNFNTAGVTASVTGLTPLGWGASNLITYSHTTGTVTTNITNSIGFSAVNGWTVISQTGNGDLVFTCPSLSLFTSNNQQNSFLIAKSGSGALTVNGNVIYGHATTGITSVYVLNISAGSVIVNGNVTSSYISLSGGTLRGISQTAGTLTINGNITPTGAYMAAHQAVNFSGSTLTINGNLLPGVGNNVISTGAVNITGNVYGNTGNLSGPGLSASNNVTVIGNVYGGPTSNGIFISNASSVIVTGNVYGGGNAHAINSQASGSVSITGDAYPWGVYSASGTVTLTGDMYNSLGRNAITSSLLYISDSTTTKWVMDLGGGATKTLYSADTFPNVPAITDVRNGITYGPALSLTGTMVVPAASDVRMDVPVDATVGTGELTSADIISGINASADPLAVRLRTILSDKTAGNLISQYNNS